MKKPKTFIKTFGVLNIGMGVIVVLYTAIGFFGYIRYGSAIQGSITFSLNEPAILAKSVQILLAMAIFFTHAIQCYVAIDIVWNEYLAPKMEKNSHKLFWEYVVRTSLVLLTCKSTSRGPSSVVTSTRDAADEVSSTRRNLDSRASMLIALRTRLL